MTVESSFVRILTPLIFLLVFLGFPPTSLQAQDQSTNTNPDTSGALLEDPGLDMSLDTPVDADSPTPTGSQEQSAGTSPSTTSDTMDLKDLELNVNEIEGSVIRRTDTRSAWRRLEKGDVVNKGDQMIVADGGTVTLTVPGQSVIKLEPGTVMTVSKLKRTLRREGILTDREQVVNKINLDMDKGTIKTNVRDESDQVNDLKLKTPQAVAGIRGTSFQCKSNRSRGTSCAVLNGTVRFASLADTSQFRELGAGRRSRIENPGDEPSDPEEIEEEAREELENFEEASSRLLVDEIQLDGIDINGEAVPRDGQGRFRYEMNYTEQAEITVAINLSIPEEDTSVPRVILRRQGEERVISDRDEWVFTLSPPVPDEGQSEVLNYTVVWEGATGQKSRAFPLRIRLNHVTSHGALPGGLESGEVAVTVDEIGGQPFSWIRFPYRLTSQDLADLKIGDVADTAIVSEDGILISGTVETDSAVAGVGYRFERGEPWMLASEDAEWSVVLPIDQLRSRGSLTLEFVAWTEDDVRGDINRVGPFEFESTSTAFPVDYSTDRTIEASVTAVAGTPVSGFPVSISSTQLEDQSLSVRGQIDADTRVVGLAVRVNGGQWVTQSGDFTDWSIRIPLGTSSTQYTIELLAWTAGGTISPLRDLGPINYEYVPPTVPENYVTGNVAVELSSVEGNGVSNMSFPYHLYQGDVSQGITYRGTASGDSLIEGVAYSVDGGESWERATGGENWSFSLPAGSNVTYDQVQVQAWTVNGVKSEPVSLETIEYDDRKFGTVFREIFTSQWSYLENGQIEQFLSDYSTTNFQFSDDVSQLQFDYSQFERLVGDLRDGVRNFRVFHNVNRVLASESGGEISADLEWRGTADAPDRPFLVKGTDVTLQFNRAPNGEFEIIAMSGLPAILYLFNEQQIRMGDLKGIIVQSLEVTGTDRADVFYQSPTPDLTVNRISIGGYVKQGGIQPVSGNFGSINSIPRINNGYDTSTVIQEGNFYAVNIRSLSDGPATALIRVNDIRSGFVEVQVISAQAFPGRPDRAVTSYRGVVPFEP